MAQILHTMLLMITLPYITQSYQHNQPLHLTAYINQGNITTARNLSRVQDSRCVIAGSYSGFITVDQLLGNHLFFWFFPARNSDPNAPLVIWLNGGPGESSMIGLLHENGPLKLRSLGSTYERRLKSWADTFAMLYIDSPVGVGYSYSDSGERGLKSKDGCSGDLYEFLKQFYAMFPEYLQRGLYIGGQSFAGKFVLSFALRLHEDIRANRTNITLTGVYFDGAILDAKVQIRKTFDLHYSLGYISHKELQDHNVDFDDFIHVFETYGLNRTFPKLFGKYNVLSLDNLRTFEFTPDFDVAAVMTSDRMRSLLHVGNRTFHSYNQQVYIGLIVELVLSDADGLVTLLDNYKVLVSNGDLDGMVGSPSTEAVLMSSRWSHQAEYNNSRREVWKERGVLVGFYTRAGQLCRVVIHDSGHRSSYDQPDSTLRMMKYFVTNGCINATRST